MCMKLCDQRRELKKRIATHEEKRSQYRDRNKDMRKNEESKE